MTSIIPILKKMHFIRAAKLVWNSAPGFTGIILFIVILEGILSVAVIYVNKLVIDAVTGLIKSGTPVNIINDALIFVGMAWILNFLWAVSNSVATVVRKGQSDKVTNHFHSILHEKAIEVDIDCYENPQYHDKLHRTQEEASYRPTQVVDGLVEIVRQTVILLFIIGLVFNFSWILTLILLISCIPQALTRWCFGINFHNWMMKRTSQQRRSWFFHWMLTVSFHAKEIRSYLLGKLFKVEYKNIQEKLRKEQLQLAARRSFFEILCSFLSTICFYAAYVIIIHHTINGYLTLGSMVMYFQAFQRVQTTFQSMLSGIAELYENNLFLSNFYEFLDIKKMVVDPQYPKEIKTPLKYGIEIKNIYFKYPTGYSTVLNNVSLEIKPGQIAALVGENGSGKTTLVKLLCRLYDPDKGEITIDGENIKNFKIEELWKQTAVMFQDFSQYPVSAKKNIWYGANYYPISQPNIDSAANLAGADKIIHHLNNGYDTILNKSFENGEELSMGEWQKIALSRFFYKNAQILILDEPTSFMDAKSEVQFFKNLREYSVDRATILISHKLPTIKVADEIFVMDHGNIVEHGTHEDLIKTGGKYTYLFADAEKMMNNVG